jgi:hypothetical protein
VYATGVRATSNVSFCQSKQAVTSDPSYKMEYCKFLVMPISNSLLAFLSKNRIEKKWTLQIKDKL